MMVAVRKKYGNTDNDREKWLLNHFGALYIICNNTNNSRNNMIRQAVKLIWRAAARGIDGVKI